MKREHQHQYGRRWHMWVDWLSVALVARNSGAEQESVIFALQHQEGHQENEPTFPRRDVRSRVRFQERLMALLCQLEIKPMYIMLGGVPHVRKPRSRQLWFLHRWLDSSTLAPSSDALCY